MKTDCEKLLKEKRKAKYPVAERDCMLSDLASPLKYLEVKRASEDLEGWRTI